MIHQIIIEYDDTNNQIFVGQLDGEPKKLTQEGMIFLLMKSFHITQQEQLKQIEANKKFKLYEEKK